MRSSPPLLPAVVYKLVKSKVFNIIISKLLGLTWSTDYLSPSLHFVDLIVLANFLFLSVYVLFIDGELSRDNHMMFT